MKKCITLILLILLSSCATNSLRENSHICSCVEIDLSYGDIISVDGLKLWLPSGSTLKESNGIDSKYWLWQSSYGEISLFWISDMARDLFLYSTPGGHCRAQGIKYMFYVWHNHKNDSVTAMSEPLLGNGAGLMVKIKLTDKGDPSVAMAVIRSIEKISR